MNPIKRTSVRGALAMALALILTAACFGIIPAVSVAAAGEADLSVSSVSASIGGNLYDGDEVKLIANVRNTGSVDVTKPFKVEFRVNGRVSDTVEYSGGITVGKYVNVSSSKNIPFVFGVHTVRASVLQSTEFAETDYQNNVYNRKVLVIDGDRPNPTTTQPASSSDQGSTDSTQPSTSGLPKNPTAVTEPSTVIYEAEYAQVLPGANVANSWPGYSGTGFVENLNEVGSGVRFNITVPESGNYSIKIRYGQGNDGGSHSVAYALNGTNSTFNVQGQKYWDAWSTREITLSLNSGLNTFTIYKNTNTVPVNIDNITVTRAYAKRFEYFAFLKENNPQLPSDIVGVLGYNTVRLTVPQGIDIKDLVATYTVMNGVSSVRVLGNVQKNRVTHNDFTNGHYYELVEGSIVRTYAVSIIRLTDNKLPVVYVDLPDDDSAGKNNLLYGYDKEWKVPFNLTVSLGANSNVLGAGKDLKLLDNASGEIKPRGNSSLSTPKRGWKIKLSNKSAVLDMPSNKHWVLVGGYADKSLMRNFEAMQLGNILNATGYTPKQRLVHLYFDGDYMGVYVLGEHVRAGSDRINVNEIETNSDIANGGWIVEQNMRMIDGTATMPLYGFGLWKEDHGFYRDFAFEINSPDEDIITAAMNEYVKNDVKDMLYALKEITTGSTRYRDVINVDSFVDWYIVNELYKNHDASGYASIFYYKKNPTSQIFMGPIWDFDIGAGNINYGYRDLPVDPEGFWIKGDSAFAYLFQDSWFVDKVKTRWREKVSSIKAWHASIADAADYLEDAANDNYQRWDMLSKYVWPQPQASFQDQTWRGYSNYMINWLDDRITWMDSQFGINGNYTG